MKRTPKENNVLSLALTLMDEYYDERERVCRQFKHICHAHLPQQGKGYEDNKNVFDIQDRTIEDIKADKAFARETILKLIQ